MTVATARFLTVIFLTTPIAFAERTEVGGLIGGGAFGVSSGEAAARGQVGVEGCLFCSGRLGLFAEYSHWFSGGTTASPFSTDRVASADLAGGGLRIQGRGRLRMFFDVGFVGGRDEHIGFASGGALGGIVVASGVQIPWHQHWYIRPHVRVYGLSPHSIEGLGVHWAVSGGLGVGYRF